jgi:hypothetical protein
MAYRRDWGQPQPGNMGFMRTAKAFGRKVNIAAADLGSGGVVGMFRLPPFFLVLGAYGNVAKLDTGTVALTFNIGDAGSANRYLAASTAGQGGGAITTLAATGFAYPVYSETEILFATVALPGAAAAGILEYYLWGTIFA